MKTPNQFYAEQVSRPDMGWNVELSEHEFTDVVEAIQLDAFKAGAEWAAQFCEDQTYAAGGKRNLNEITYDTACIDCQKLILSETSNLKEIPK